MLKCVKRNLEWVEKLDGGVKRKVRVSFTGKGRVKWQFQLSDREGWDYDSPPTLDDWETLEDTLEALYRRRRAKYELLESVRELRRKAEGR
jgi:hypothetical protein